MDGGELRTMSVLIDKRCIASMILWVQLLTNPIDMFNSQGNFVIESLEVNVLRLAAKEKKAEEEKKVEENKDGAAATDEKKGGEAMATSKESGADTAEEAGTEVATESPFVTEAA